MRERLASLRRAVGSLQFGLKPESVWAAQTHLSFSATGGENNTTPPVLPCPQICISPLISKVHSLARRVQEANGETKPNCFIQWWRDDPEENERENPHPAAFSFFVKLIAIDSRIDFALSFFF